MYKIRLAVRRLHLNKHTYGRILLSDRAHICIMGGDACLFGGCEDEFTGSVQSFERCLAIKSVVHIWSLSYMCALMSSRTRWFSDPLWSLLFCAAFLSLWCLQMDVDRAVRIRWYQNRAISTLQDSGCFGWALACKMSCTGFEREREVVWNHRVAVHFLCPSGLQMPGCENGLQTTDVPAERLVADDLSWCWQDCLRRGSTRIPNRSSSPQNLSSMHNLAERLDASTWQRQVIWLWLSRLSQGGPFHGWNMVKEIHWEPMIWKTERHYEVSVLLWFIQVGRAPLYRQDREG